MVLTSSGAWLAWTAPNSLLLIAGPAAALPSFDVARTRLQGTRTVAFDASDARSAVCIEGAAGAALLAGGCPADVSVEGFGEGSVRATVLGALPCTIAKPAGRAGWWVMVPRSYGTSLRGWLRGPWLDFDVVDALEAALP
jgi:heterotetrameric sarcosine oxidase gamma subunit